MNYLSLYGITYTMVRMASQFDKAIVGARWKLLVVVEIIFGLEVRIGRFH